MSNPRDFNFPSRENLETFIESHCKVLDCGSGHTGHSRQRRFHLSGSKVQNKASFVVKSKPENKCPSCTKMHVIIKCPKFLQASPSDLYSLIKTREQFVSIVSKVNTLWTNVHLKDAVVSVAVGIIHCCTLELITLSMHLLNPRSLERIQTESHWNPSPP